MRSYLDGPSSGRNGWLSALSDTRLAPAIEAMHDDPARSWSVQELAAVTAQSRTTFAVRFKRVTGQTPIDYLTEWRMLLAADRLRRTNLPVVRIAADVGYTS
uniref:helix-turn-helix domain-containing protein n=1 Tax=uncultured Tateyamaria sp. TaxID=455651 RepID=UPI00260E8F0A